MAYPGGIARATTTRFETASAYAKNSQRERPTGVDVDGGTDVELEDERDRVVPLADG